MRRYRNSLFPCYSVEQREYPVSRSIAQLSAKESIPKLIPPTCLLQWDRAISSMLIRSSLGLSFGVVFSVLLFKRRAWPVWLGTGFGAGRAWEEADGMFSMSPDSGTPVSADGMKHNRLT